LAGLILFLHHIPYRTKEKEPKDNTISLLFGGVHNQSK